jgi:hypothetical protein
VVKRPPKKEKQKMKMTFLFVPIAIVALSASTLAAQDLVFDSFSEGAGSLSVVTGTKSVTQTGAGIVGGNRTIQLAYPSGDNLYGQPVEVKVQPQSGGGPASALVSSVGYQAYGRLTVEYGQTAALGLNLTSPVAYNHLRLNFAALSGPLNLNVDAFSGVNNEGEACGIFLPASLTPFTVDFPFVNYPDPSWFSNVETLVIIFQGGQVYGGPNLAITEFSAGTSTDPKATFTCGTT